MALRGQRCGAGQRGIARRSAARLGKPRTGVKECSPVTFPAREGVVLLDLAAKGLEFDQVIVADAQRKCIQSRRISRP